MLNELYQAASTPDVKRLFVSEQDNRLKSLPKVTDNTPAFKLCLGKSDIITSVSKLSREQVLPLKKYEFSNGFSFPSFNLPPYLLVPLVTFEEECILNFRPDLKEDIDKINEKERSRYITKCFRDYFNQWNLIEFISEFHEITIMQNRQQTYLAAVTNKLEKCLHEASLNLWKSMRNPYGESLSLELLFERVSKITPEEFRNAVACKTLGMISTYEDWQKFLPLIVLTQSVGSSIPGVSVVLDVEDYADDGYPVAHEETIQWINRKLLFFDQKKANSSVAVQFDAFGNPSLGSNEKMPSVRMPITGDVILRSMVKESPCQYRYRKVDSDSYLIGNDSRKMAKVAIETLSQEEFRGFTWDGLGKQELLFAYPSELPKKEKIPVAKFITGSGEKESLKGLSATIIKYLSGINKPLHSIEIRVFALKKMDRARTKVIYHLNFSAQRLKDSADEWQEGCTNIPKLRIKEWGESKGETVFLDSVGPFPVEVSDVVNKVWKQDGSVAGISKSFSKTVGIDLLIEKPDKPFVTHMLNLLLRNSSGFLICLGQACHSRKIFGNKQQFAKDKVMIPATFGLLLYKLGCKKEDYMKDTAYLIGNLLAITDELHYLYCKNVRTTEEDKKANKINAPTQMLGNSHVVSALESPERTLSILANRIMPYIGWAQSNNTDDAGLSRYFRKQYREIALQISYQPLPKRLNDEGRAALLLGYLAGVDKKTEKTTEEEK